MIKKILLYSFIFLFAWVIPGYAQESPPLSGDILLRDIQEKSTDHPAQHAFDGRLDTYMQVNANNYTSSTGSNWVGLDLKNQYIIDSVGFCPRTDIVSTDYPNRTVMGLFEGGNNADFSDALPLVLITKVPGREMTYLPVNCSKGVRYVRFVFPSRYSGTDFASTNNYMAELQFFGHPGAGNNSHLPQLTNIPTFVIHTREEKNITSKEVYQTADLTIVYNNGTKIFHDSTEIRGRGNASWGFTKKPYRIKLFKKTRLMDMPANAKSWTLISNEGDKTLMRNLLAFDISRKIEMPYTTIGVPVDVFLNGDYKGCYQFCDQIEARAARVDVEGNGGMLVELDWYQDGNKKFTTGSPYNIQSVVVKYPDDDEITDAQFEEVQREFKHVTVAVGQMSVNNQSQFNQYVDVETFLRYILIGEYTCNTDHYQNVYMHKKPGNPMWYTGPVWDFDLAFENDYRTHPIFEKYGNDFLFRQIGNSGGQTRDMFIRVMQYALQQNRLQAIWHYYRDRNIISTNTMLAVADQLSENMHDSRELNFIRWPILNVNKHANYTSRGSFEAEFVWLKQFITDRINWLDNKLNYTEQTPYMIRFNKPEKWENVLLTAWIPGEKMGDSLVICRNLQMTKQQNHWYKHEFDYGYRHVSVRFSDDTYTTTPVTDISNAVCIGTTGNMDTREQCEAAPISCYGESEDPHLKNDTISVRFSLPLSWKTCRVRAWLPKENNRLLTADTGNVMTFEQNRWYTYDFVAENGLVSLRFNNGKDIQTSIFHGINRDCCFVTTGVVAASLWVIDTADCETGHSQEPYNGIKQIELAEITLYRQNRQLTLIKHTEAPITVRVFTLLGQVLYQADMQQEKITLTVPEGFLLVNTYNPRTRKQRTFKCE
ncbi:MAG: CotH kinase family protein [Bacteroidales bacterium]|jgi:hypothetical protein|nr:CotH kinase family protein [Bacteroidales bacterium]